MAAHDVTLERLEEQIDWYDRKSGEARRRFDSCAAPLPKRLHPEPDRPKSVEKSKALHRWRQGQRLA